MEALIEADGPLECGAARTTEVKKRCGDTSLPADMLTDTSIMLMLRAEMLDLSQGLKPCLMNSGET